MARVLIVDDDPAIRDVVRFALERAGFQTSEAANGKAALASLAAARPDLVVLDILMPELDGIEVCREIRRTGPTPVVFLSSKDEEVDRIVGLELGGDDYLVKPFSPRELVARVRAVLRRGAVSAQAAPDTVLRRGRLTLDLDLVRAAWDERDVSLTATEFGLLRTLMARPGRICSREALMDGAYRIERVVSDRTIDSHIRRLRAKFEAIGAAPIETAHGLGYKLTDCV